MKIIVGLGNPGEKYQNTRHNLGYMTLDSLLEKFEPQNRTFWPRPPRKTSLRGVAGGDENLKALIKKINYKGQDLILAKPTTFMNESGLAVAKVLSYYKVEARDLIVIQDELDIPFGKIRIRFGGGAGGHHGVESIINHIGDKFLRIRLGIGMDNQHESRREHAERYVLGNISSNERGKARSMIKQATKEVELLLTHGIEGYMSKYNK